MWVSSHPDNLQDNLPFTNALNMQAVSRKWWRSATSGDDMYIGSTLFTPQSTHYRDGGQPENHHQDLTASSGSCFRLERTQLKGWKKITVYKQFKQFFKRLFPFPFS